MLLPGSHDLAVVRFESAPIKIHFVADRKPNGDSAYQELGGEQKDYVLTSYHGAPAVLIVLAQLSGQRRFIDSALVRRDGLGPIWEIQHSGSKRTRLDYDGASVRRAVTEPDSSTKQSTTTYPFRVFNFNELDELVRSVPLRAGYRAIVPLYSEGDNALETDTIQVEGTDNAGVWNVRFADKVIIGHYGIDGASRTIVRFDVNRHADKAHFRYLFGSDSTQAVARTIQPGSSLLRTDRIHPYTDSISLVLIPKDSAQRIAGTLVRQVQVARDNGVALFRETQVYTFATGKTEVDTLDVDASTLEAIRVVEINAHASHDLRFHDGRLTGTVWSADSGRKVVDTPFGAAFFHGMVTESLLAAFPLAANDTLHLPVAETPGVMVHLATFRVTGTTTLHTAAGAVECLVVQESPSTVAWVSRASGRLVRLHWTLPNGTAIWKLPTLDVPLLDTHVTA